MGEESEEKAAEKAYYHLKRGVLDAYKLNRRGVTVNHFEAVIKGAERETGLSAEEIRSNSPDKFRSYLRERKGKDLVVKSEFPTIGRGNILRDKLATTKAINEDIDRILAK